MTGNHARTPGDANPPTGKAYWHSLEELADSPAFRQWVADEFPGGLGQLEGVSRRGFLKIMAASFALAGMTGCERLPPDELVPYVRAPLGRHADKPTRFATALARGGYAHGVVVTSYDGRPTKIEGNPDHPASRGATDVFAQAEILTFYDPERSAEVIGPDGPASWDGFARAARQRLTRHRADGAGSAGGLRLLTGHVTSPTLLREIERFLEAHPESRWHMHEAVDDPHGRAAADAVLGQPADWVYQFERAERVLSLGSDFLFELPGSVRHARDFAAGRRSGADGQSADINRLYVAEPTPTITGAKADERLRLGPGELEACANALAAELGIRADTSVPQALSEHARRFIGAAAEDLAAHRGRCLVLAGQGLSPRAHALVMAINASLGAMGKTLYPIAPLCATASGRRPDSLAELADDIAEGKVDTLLMIDVDPVYDAPADLAFGERLAEVAFSAHLGLHANATAQACRWRLPRAHDLESWGDVRAYDGTASIQQPLIAPLYRGRTPAEMLALLRGATLPEGQALVRATWQGQHGGGDFEAWWRAALQAGVVPDSAAPALAGAKQADAMRAVDELPSAPAAEQEAGLRLVFAPGARMWDGRYANNAWLQELPHPLTSVTWDNAALISPATADRLGVRSDDVITLIHAGAQVAAPVFVLPGQADDTVTVALGYGNDALGRVASGVGFNAYPLRTRSGLWHAGAVELGKTERTHPLATTQNHHALEGRTVYRGGTLEEFEHDAHKFAHPHQLSLPVVSLYPQWNYPGQQWGMSIDLTACIGCGACTVACQAENNIAVVGREQVRRGREMHWIRIDRYFAGTPDDPAIHQQPVPCMHCENAPCEVVCPVGATQHSHDGLNEMIYNRCIGTRYCSNNCPYKVRRFNFLRYTDYDTETFKLQRNPEVSVRARGVMEKCTYCVQRIRTAEIAARKADRAIADGEVVTACQQVCPTQAIVFGDINDGDSAVSREQKKAHTYGMLTELNTRPRTTYLAEVRNPNPALAGRTPEKKAAPATQQAPEQAGES